MSTTQEKPQAVNQLSTTKRRRKPRLLLPYTAVEMKGGLSVKEVTVGIQPARATLPLFLEQYLILITVKKNIKTALSYQERILRLRHNKLALILKVILTFYRPFLCGGRTYVLEKSDKSD